MGFWDISRMAIDSDLQSRVSACAAQEQDADPVQWMADHMLNLAAQPGWDAAWASAVAAGNPAPGRDEAVITDGMILSGVQALVA
jgi:hypothetical protein